MAEQAEGEEIGLPLKDEQAPRPRRDQLTRVPEVDGGLPGVLAALGRARLGWYDPRAEMTDFLINLVWIFACIFGGWLMGVLADVRVTPLRSGRPAAIA